MKKRRAINNPIRPFCAASFADIDKRIDEIVVRLRTLERRSTPAEEVRVGDLVRKKHDKKVGIIRTHVNTLFGVEWEGSVRNRGWAAETRESIEPASLAM